MIPSRWQSTPRPGRGGTRGDRADETNGKREYSRLPPARREDRVRGGEGRGGEGKSAEGNGIL